MSNAQHTPGPWESSSTSVWSGEKMVAAVYGDDPDCNPDGRMKSNARLIAAAPELLEALQAVVSQLEGHDLHNGDVSAINNAYAAISKATKEQPK